MVRIGYSETARLAEQHGWQASHTLVGDARQYAMNGNDGTRRIMYDRARFLAALAHAERCGSLRGLDGWV